MVEPIVGVVAMRFRDGAPAGSLLFAATFFIICHKYIDAPRRAPGCSSSRAPPTFRRVSAGRDGKPKGRVASEA